MNESTSQPDRGPNLDVLDFEKLMNSAPNYVSGMHQDLIRDANDNPVRWLHNAHAKPDDRRKAFIIGRGWSATVQRRWRIEHAGIPVMAINDYPKDGPKPLYWCTGDPPSYFGNRIWDDIDVIKFSPLASVSILRPREDAYAPKLTPRDAPNTHFFNHCYDDPTIHQWLHVPWINWGTSLFGDGCPKEWYSQGAARSSMFVALRLLWHLGFREVYLLGCDMTPGHHPAPMYVPTILYLIEQLVPTFKRFGYHVMQCNPHSHLRCFDFADFDEVVA